MTKNGSQDTANTIATAIRSLTSLTRCFRSRKLAAFCETEVELARIVSPFLQTYTATCM